MGIAHPQMVLFWFDWCSPVIITYASIDQWIEWIAYVPTPDGNIIRWDI